MDHPEGDEIKARRAAAEKWINAHQPVDADQLARIEERIHKSREHRLLVCTPELMTPSERAEHKTIWSSRHVEEEPSTPTNGKVRVTRTTMDPRDVAEALAPKLEATNCFDSKRGWMVKRPNVLWRDDENDACINRFISKYIQRLRDEKTISRLIRNEEVAKLLFFQNPLYHQGEWNFDPTLNGGPEGMIFDITTGEARKAKPTDRVTKAIGFMPSEGPHPTWDKVIRHICEYEPDAQAWLQRFLGSCMTGNMDEHKFLFLQGAGGGGKTTFVETVKLILGDYAKSVDGNVLLGRSDHHRQWVARLQGARLCIVSEMPTGSWQTGTLKSLVSGDTVTANFMRQNSFDFRPTAKFILAGNNKPRIAMSDSGFRRRMVLIPVRAVPANERFEMKQQLIEEAPCITTWIMEGARIFLQEGLGPTPKVWVDATTEYHESEDPIRDWWTSKCKRDDQQFVATRTLINSYNEFTGSKLKTATTILEWLKNENIPFWTDKQKDAHGKTHRGIMGIDLDDDVDDDSKSPF